MEKLQLASASVENLRGYFNAHLDLSKPRILIVGPNNAGKTSILKLLDWCLNRVKASEFSEFKALSAEEQKFLLPARSTKHRARRLTLGIQVLDSRSWSKFKCKETAGLAFLRFNIRLTPQNHVYLALGKPQRSESSTSNHDAIELLKRAQKLLSFSYIPSFRDTQSSRFSDTFQGAINRRVEQKLTHSAQGGAPAEYRKLKGNYESLCESVLESARPLWEDVKNRLPPGLANDASLTLDCDQQVMLRFLESRLKLQLTTGEHDSGTVPLDELGSGLQSVLDLVISETEVPSDRTVIVAAEEPEAFLHPSAQRTLSGRLLKSDVISKTVITTHSPIVVEEAQFGDVAVCRDQKFFQPASVNEKERDEINTALLSGLGSEVVFARSVMLVEGEGDRQFFEQLRRRLSPLDQSGGVDQCIVIPVGSNTQFSPWIRLIRSYGTQGERPISWLVVADADSGPDLRKAFNNAGLSIRQDVIDSIKTLDSAKYSGVHPDWKKAAIDASWLAFRSGTNMHFLAVDLEESMLEQVAATDFLDTLKSKSGIGQEVGFEQLLSRLGSKAYGASGNALKAPWIRAFVGRHIAPEYVSKNSLVALYRWTAAAIGDIEARTLLETFTGNNIDWV